MPPPLPVRPTTGPLTPRPAPVQRDPADRSGERRVGGDSILDMIER
jgi:hypothetical protein